MRQSVTEEFSEFSVFKNILCLSVCCSLKCLLCSTGFHPDYHSETLMLSLFLSRRLQTVSCEAWLARLPPLFLYFDRLLKQCNWILAFFRDMLSTHYTQYPRPCLLGFTIFYKDMYLLGCPDSWATKTQHPGFESSSGPLLCVLVLSLPFSCLLSTHVRKYVCQTFPLYFSCINSTQYTSTFYYYLIYISYSVVLFVDSIIRSYLHYIRPMYW